MFKSRKGAMHVVLVGFVALMFVAGVFLIFRSVYYDEIRPSLSLSTDNNASTSITQMDYIVDFSPFIFAIVIFMWVMVNAQKQS